MSPWDSSKPDRSHSSSGTTPHKVEDKDQNRDNTRSEQHEHSDDETLAPTLRFSKNEGTLQSMDDGRTLVNGKLPDINDIGFGETSKNARALLSSHLSQWSYNDNRIALHRALAHAKGLLREVEQENKLRPMYFDDKVDDLKVLKLQTKFDLDLDKNAWSKFLDSQVQEVLRHLESLSKRVNDISSKVFITGDLNTGKSNFCNSLLKRKVLPEDQLPCTNVFCEILECKENRGKEEVHAICNASNVNSVKEANQRYQINDKSTYEIHPLSSLSDLVLDNKKYAFLKVYIRDDNRPPEKSLLRNGIVDISLIDSPGLNLDSLQTTEVMARQEEIDLVIFVVNAENQLTLSAKEFISLASKEKKYMFFVVKKFDKIRDKERCKRLILDQIRLLSPESHKEAANFVHFMENYNEDGGGEGPGGDGPDGNDDPEDNPDPNFDHLEDTLRNFVLKKRSLSKLLPAKTYLLKLLDDVSLLSRMNLMKYESEEALIKSQLNDLNADLLRLKRSLENLTHDADRIVESVIADSYSNAKLNIGSFFDAPTMTLPPYQGLSKIYDFIFETEQCIREYIRQSVEIGEFYAKEKTQSAVQEIRELGEKVLGKDFMSGREFKYQLMFSTKKHGSGRKLAVNLSISDLFAPSWHSFFQFLNIGNSERFLSRGHPTQILDEESLEKTQKPTNALTKVLGLGSYPLMQYWMRPSLLFTSNVPTLTVYLFGGAKIIGKFIIDGAMKFSWDTVRRVSTTLLVFAGALGFAYIIHDLPRALPANLIHKYRLKLQELDYVHSNSERISREVRSVLKIPNREIVKSCEVTLEKQQTDKSALESKAASNAISKTFFRQLLERSNGQKQAVDKINLNID